ncbi:MAG: hypothetical protein M2R46_04415 [Verrucomicrobia subdivision 3 bacterium]|nr:hypothetical protein [Limisphaerales bacterium]
MLFIRIFGWMAMICISSSSCDRDNLCWVIGSENPEFEGESSAKESLNQCPAFRLKRQICRYAGGASKI